MEKYVSNLKWNIISPQLEWLWLKGEKIDNNDENAEKVKCLHPASEDIN